MSNSSKTDQNGRKTKLIVSKSDNAVSGYTIMAIYTAVRPHIAGSLFCHFNL